MCCRVFAPAAFSVIVFLVSITVLGFSELFSVCESRARKAGLDAVVPIGCGDAAAGDGELVMFSCDMTQEGLVAGELSKGQGEFESMLSSYIGTGVKVVAEMYQCVETKHSSRRRGGTYYTYSKDWKSTPMDFENSFALSDNDFRSNCNASNPAWPEQVPRSGNSYVQKVKTGAFTLLEPYPSMIPLDTPISGHPPSDWEMDTGDQFTTSQYAASKNGIGKMRVNFYGTDWSNPMITVLGENNRSHLQPWVAPSSWLCSGWTLSHLLAGRVSKDGIFGSLEAMANDETWYLRLTCFLLAWAAFRCVLDALTGPLEAVTDGIDSMLDSIPCVKKNGCELGDSVRIITCCISCAPAAACSLLVIGIVGIAIRPWLGIPLVLGMVLIVVGLAAWKSGYLGKEQEDSEEEDVEVAKDANASLLQINPLWHS